MLAQGIRWQSCGTLSFSAKLLLLCPAVSGGQTGQAGCISNRREGEEREWPPVFPCPSGQLPGFLERQYSFCTQGHVGVDVRQGYSLAHLHNSLVGRGFEFKKPKTFPICKVKKTRSISSVWLPGSGSFYFSQW